MGAEEILKDEIWSINADQLDLILPLAKRIFAEAKYPGELSWPTFTHFWDHVLRTDAGKIFVHGDPLDGMIGTLYVPGLFNGWPTTMLHFWYVAPEKRKTRLGKALFDRVEEEGARRGSKVMLAAHLFAINGDAMKGFFEARGFVNHELGYRKIYG